jgi:hypothetical protein
MKLFTQAQIRAGVFGALGALVPLIASLVVADVGRLADVDTAVIVGYVLRSLGLMFLGAIAVALQEVTDFRQALQLGMVAPALITSMINGSAIQKAEYQWFTPAYAGDFAVTATTTASTSPTTSEVSTSKEVVEEPLMRKVLRGIIGDY